jgi:hypothetical protein
MKMKNKYTIHFLLFSTIFTLSASLHAQTFLGLQHSNMSGIHQAGLNPANIADSRHRVYINGLTMGVGFNNDYLSLSLPFPFRQLVTGNVPNQYKNSSGGLAFRDEWLKENLNGRPKNMNFYTQFRTPGVMFKISKGLSVGLQYKNTLSFQINDVAEDFARLARYGIDSSNGTVAFSGPNNFQVGKTFGDNAFTINVNAYGELGATVAKTIINNDNMVIKVGATPKLLLGYATGYIKNKGMQVRAPGSDTIIFGQTDIEYGYTDPSYFKDINGVNFDLINSKIQGKGFGLDIGTTFEYKPDVTKAVTSKKNNYLFRAGISLLDAGNITYKQQVKNRHVTNTSGDKALVLTPEFANAWQESEARGIQYTDSLMRTIFVIDSSAQTIKSKMPTTINLQFDYNVFKFFYVGANLSQDFRGKKSVGIRKPSYIVLMPRIETKLFEFSIPVGLMNDYRTGRVGFFLRLGPVFIGSDNLIGQLRSNNVNGVDFYFGISTGVPSKKKKDSETPAQG